MAIDPAVPVPEWGLSAPGRERATAVAAEPWIRRLVAVFASMERKAIETAELIAEPIGLTVATDAELGENDRSATGFLPPDEFERVADEFFAQPDVSVRGWERAIDAQRRIVDAVERCLRAAPPGNVAVVAHGAVGTLLRCHLLGIAIDRRHDQPGVGSGYTVDRSTLEVLGPWERLPAAWT
ncbi:MAG: histidine phosphatase family protein [Ilumatobacteraceae bacterium]